VDHQVNKEDLALDLVDHLVKEALPDTDLQEVKRSS